MNNIRKLHFHLFDGDGGGTGGADGGMGGAEASAFMSSIGMEGETNQPPAQETVEYGIDPGADDSEGQVGADQQKGTEGEPAGTSTDGEADDLDAEFAQLIEGKFKDIYGKRVAETINSRFKNQADYAEELEATDRALSPLYIKYGLEIGDIEGLEEAISGDESLFAAEAEDEGITPEQYQANIALQIEAAQARQMREQIEEQQHQRELDTLYRGQAAELSEAFPAFDLDMEYQTNEKFADALDRLGNVQDAFYLAHRDDILRGSQNQTQQQTQQDMVTNIKKKAARPPESAAKPRPAVVRKSDPSKLTDEDIDKIMKDLAENPEKKIYF